MDNRKELDSFGLAGAILNIVVSGIVAVTSAIILIGGIIIFWDNDSIGLLYFCIGILFGSVSIISLVFNTKFLSGEYKYQKIASIMGFICLSILGSVLLTISKIEEDNEKILNDLKVLKEFFDKNIINETEYQRLKEKIIFQDNS